MGLCVLDEIEANLSARHTIWEKYARELAGLVQLQKRGDDLSYNLAYFPVVFKSEQEAVQVADLLRDNGILTRRYFFPSLETVQFLDQKEIQTHSNNMEGEFCVFQFMKRWKIRNRKMLLM